MAIVILDSLTQSSDGTAIALVDTTGTYNTNTRPGGYGAGQSPSGKREYTDITNSFIIVEDQEGTETFISLSQADAQTLADPSNTTGYDIDYSVVDSDETVWYPQVYTITYYPVFPEIELTQNITFTAGSTAFSWASDDTGITSALTHILAPTLGSITADDTYHFPIASLNLTARTGVLTKAWSGSTGTITSTSLRWGYANTVSGGLNNHVAPIYELNADMTSALSQLTYSPCTCRNYKVKRYWETFGLLFAIQAAMNSSNYQGAQEMIDDVIGYFEDPNFGTCGCS
jgi:hypothetical protein